MLYSTCSTKKSQLTSTCCFANVYGSLPYPYKCGSSCYFSRKRVKNSSMSTSTSTVSVQVIFQNLAKFPRILVPIVFSRRIYSDLCNKLYLYSCKWVIPGKISHPIGRNKKTNQLNSTTKQQKLLRFPAGVDQYIH
jgi:hypothetical protein